jgi:transposase
MFIIGGDSHTRFQPIAMLKSASGEISERRLEHESGEAKPFYEALPSSARVGMEATGQAHWFARMLAEQGHELWVGDAAQIRAGMVRKQKTDPRDAYHLLKMLQENRFPRIWIPSPAERDLRQRLPPRMRLVRFRTSVMNQLHVLALGQGPCRRKKLWTTVGRKEREGLPCGPGANRRKQELLERLDPRSPSLKELDLAVEKEAARRANLGRLMEPSGVAPVTAWAFVLTSGPIDRFPKSKQRVSYLGLNPTESRRGGKQRLGSLSKQGNSMRRYLLVEAAQGASRFEAELRRNHLRLKFRRGRAAAKVASARKLAGRLSWKLRDVRQPSAAGAHAGQPA